ATVEKNAEKIVKAESGGTEKAAKAVVEASNLNFFYGSKQALFNINIRIPEKTVTAFIGPSGCGKSTFLRSINRMNDVIPDIRIDGKITIEGNDIYQPGIDIVDLRRRVGMVFQKSNPFPKTIFENVAYGIRINRMAGSKAQLHQMVEKALRQAA